MSRSRLLPLLLLAAPGIACAVTASAPQYRAELAAPASADRLIVRDTLWHCGGGTCVAAIGASRPAVVCAALAREAGALRSFAVDGRVLAADALEKCNARAR